MKSESHRSAPALAVAALVIAGCGSTDPTGATPDGSTVDPADPPTAEELLALCRSRLAGYKCPRTVEVVASVGRNAMGKINKRALRASYWEGSRTIG